MSAACGPRLARGALFAFFCAGTLVACAPHDTRTPNWIEIPAGYRGALVVQFDDPSCPPLQRRDAYEVIRFGDDGRACTSEAYEDQIGVASDHIFYVDADGHRVEIDNPDAALGTMYAGSLHRMSGWVFVPPHSDPYADHATVSCRWSDVPCWKVLRQPRP